MNILAIRGGALGDFIVTLPMVRLLREKWPEANIEVLGNPRICEIAVDRYYLNGVRSVNHRPLSAFFTSRAILDPEWMNYIGDFELVLSYFYDPDGLFLTNLKRCNPVEILTHSPQVPAAFNRSAAYHFGEIVRPLGLELSDDIASEIFPSATDVNAARAFLTGLPAGTRLVAIHPGSGSETKNWPIESWAELGKQIVRKSPDIALLLVEGEADQDQGRFLVEAWKDIPYLRARWLPLPILAAVLREATLFLGHDSGITHLAAASRRDLPVIALFGLTDPVIWAPPRKEVRVLKGTPALKDLTVDEVFRAAEAWL